MIDHLIEKSRENSDEDEMNYSKTLNDCKSSSCALYIVLFVVFLVASIATSSIFIYIYWYLKVTNFYY